MTSWLSKEPRTLWIALTILVIPLMYDVWCSGITNIYSLCGLYNDMVAASPNSSMSVTAAMWLFMIPWVLGEEIVFRFPLSFAARFLKRWPRLRNWIVTLMIVALSGVFGWLHGGWLFVPMQGVLGVAFCIFYLKCGGFNGKFWKPLFICWLLHAVVNSQIFAMELASNAYGL